MANVAVCLAPDHEGTAW